MASPSEQPYVLIGDEVHPILVGDEEAVAAVPSATAYYIPVSTLHEEQRKRCLSRAVACSGRMLAFLFLACIVGMYFIMPRVPQFTVLKVFVNGTNNGSASTADMWADVELFNSNYADLHLTSLELSFQQEDVQVGTLVWQTPITIAARQRLRYYRDVDLTLVGQACVILQCGQPALQPLDATGFLTASVGAFAPFRKAWSKLFIEGPILHTTC